LHPEILRHRDAIAALCRRFGVTRLEVFGSAARGDDFDPARSDVDLLVEFGPDSQPGLAALVEFGDALEATFGRKVDVMDRAALLASPNHIRRRSILADATPFSPRRRPATPRADTRDLALALDIVLACDSVTAFVTGLDVEAFRASDLHHHAVARGLGLIGGAAARLSAGFRRAVPDMPWPAVIGLRDLVAFEAGEPDPDCLWQAATGITPSLAERLRPLIPPDGDS
jgi:predicted nucleotidyltransferase/uncharacterized protein with HEPN domain